MDDDRYDERTLAPHPMIFPEVGWLAPDGKYYPCDMNGVDRSSMWYERKAWQCVNAFYPGELDMDDYKAEPQTFLAEKGWLRTDVERLWFVHRPTRQQIGTLSRLYEKEQQFGRGYLSKEQMRLIMAWCGLKWMNRTDDNYTMLECSVPEEERTPGFAPPRLTPPTGYREAATDDDR